MFQFIIKHLNTAQTADIKVIQNNIILKIYLPCACTKIQQFSSLQKLLYICDEKIEIIIVPVHEVLYK